MGSTLALSVKACPGFPPVVWLCAELQQAASHVLLLSRRSSAPAVAPGADLGTSRSLRLGSPVDTSGTVLITAVYQKKVRNCYFESTRTCFWERAEVVASEKSPGIKLAVSKRGLPVACGLAVFAVIGFCQRGHAVTAETAVGGTHRPVWMEVWGLGPPRGALLVGACWNDDVNDAPNCSDTGLN